MCNFTLINRDGYNITGVCRIYRLFATEVAARFHAGALCGGRAAAGECHVRIWAGSATSP